MNEQKSLVDVAYEILSERYEAGGKDTEPMDFISLLLEIGKRKGYDDENKLLDLAAGIYTELTIDGRFVIKGDNKWVLKEHELFDNIHIDMNDAYGLDDEEEEEEEKKSVKGDEDENGEEADDDDGVEDEEEDELIDGSGDEAAVTSGEDDEND